MQASTEIVSLGSFSLGKLKNVSVSQVKGKTIVDIREYYLEEATQAEKPGKKGIALSVSQWTALSEVKEKLVDGAMFPLGDMRKVSHSIYKGSLLVQCCSPFYLETNFANLYVLDQAFINIREYYVDKTSGEEKPGIKGSALSLSQWSALQEHWTEIDALLGIFPEPAAP